jgi:hypothetical protein
MNALLPILVTVYTVPDMVTSDGIIAVVIVVDVGIVTIAFDPATVYLILPTV